MVILVCAISCPTMLPAHVPEDSTLEEVKVLGRRLDLAGEARSASEGVIGHEDLALRPLLRPGDLLESIPGLIMTQHSGSGKGNQMFLRGFNLDHGTDFSTRIDGMPVNLPTHGHGQGYTDINFVIPELVKTIDYVKGPYHAELGDFSSAGGAHIRTFQRLPNDRFTVGIGENGYRRFLAAGSGDLASGHVMGAVEGQAYDGPWTDIDEDVEKINGLLRWSREDGAMNYGVTAMFFDSQWNSADQIPQRAVEQKLIDPYGSLDRTLGGSTRRFSLSGQLRREGAGFRDEINAWIIGYDLELWSNFTYLLDDPVNGDQFKQLDERTIYGGDWTRYWTTELGDSHLHHAFGIQFRYDDVDPVGLLRTRERRPIGITRLDDVQEAALGAFYELQWRFSSNWRTVLGIRADRFRFDVESDRPENSGSESDGILSPKGSVIYRIGERSEAYVSGGFGFHSNDARGTTISVDPTTGEPAEPVDPLVRSKGAELGFRFQDVVGWYSSLALWMLKLDSELLFVGDAGITEPSRPSKRWGMEFNNTWTITDVWRLEADFAWTDARFTDDSPEGDRIPGAIRTVVTGAISADWPSGWFGSLRLRYFGKAPLIEDNSVSSNGSKMINMLAGWSNPSWRLQVEVLNLLDSTDHDIDYFYASRLAGEPAGGVEDIHFHIFEPRQVRLQATWLF
jgi:hypothetical protein